MCSIRVDRSLRALMLSVVEQRAGQWGALTAASTAAAAEQVATGDDQHDASGALYVEGNPPANQQYPADTSSYNHPSVSTSHGILNPVIETLS